MTAGQDWTVHGHFIAADGDRTALLELNGRWAVLWSYAAPHTPQFVDYREDESRAREVFCESRKYTARKAGLTYDSREDWNGSSA